MTEDEFWQIIETSKSRLCDKITTVHKVFKIFAIRFGKPIPGRVKGDNTGGTDGNY